MKKLKIVAVLAVILVMCLTACTPKTVYDTLETLANKEYQKLTIAVETTVQNHTFKSNYTIQKTVDGIKVDFTEEQLALIQDVPFNQTETKQGSFKVVDGKIQEQTGDTPSVQITALAITWKFQESNFAEVVQTENSFIAKVQDLKAFAEITGTEGNIVLTFTEEAFQTAQLTYSTTQSHVKATFTFVA